VQYSDVVTLRSHSTFDGGPITGVVHFLIDGELVGSSIVDETGIGMTDVTMNLTPGDYLVDAMFVSDVPEIDPGFATSILTVIPESATVTPMPGNPTSIQASAAGTASGGTGPICFAITEPADGSPGDTTFVSGNVQISGLSTSTLTLGAITFSEGGVGLARKACFPLALSNTPIGVYLIALNIEGTYIGFGTTSLSVIQSKADLLVSMSADKLNPKQGDRMTYTVAVTNFGPDTALNTVMNDALSSGTTFVSAKANKGTFTAPPAGQAGTVTWYLGDLANAGQEAAQIQVTVIVKGRTTITNTASVSSIASDPNPANNTASLTTSVAQGATKK
jgi:uncharacterized repeat protein (TIGR01451 family)